ncbi:hypothetical protein LLG95_13000 [bacterium]|nr:hypothetical protein [bacterium]
MGKNFQPPLPAPGEQKQKLPKKTRLILRLLVFILNIALIAFAIGRDTYLDNLRVDFGNVLKTIKLGDTYHDKMFKPSPIELATPGTSFDKIIVYSHRTKLAVLGLKENRIAAYFMSYYFLHLHYTMANGDMIAEGSTNDARIIKMDAQTKQKTGRQIVELYHLLRQNDSIVTRAMNKSSQKYYANMLNDFSLLMVSEFGEKIPANARP